MAKKHPFINGINPPEIAAAKVIDFVVATRGDALASILASQAWLPTTAELVAALPTGALDDQPLSATPYSRVADMTLGSNKFIAAQAHLYRMRDGSFALGAGNRGANPDGGAHAFLEEQPLMPEALLDSVVLFDHFLTPNNRVSGATRAYGADGGCKYLRSFSGDPGLAAYVSAEITLSQLPGSPIQVSHEIYHASEASKKVKDVCLRLADGGLALQTLNLVATPHSHFGELLSLIHTLDLPTLVVRMSQNMSGLNSSTVPRAITFSIMEVNGNYTHRVPWKAAGYYPVTNDSQTGGLKDGLTLKVDTYKVVYQHPAHPAPSYAAVEPIYLQFDYEPADLGALAVQFPMLDFTGATVDYWVNHASGMADSGGVRYSVRLPMYWLIPPVEASTWAIRLATANASVEATAIGTMSHTRVRANFWVQRLCKPDLIAHLNHQLVMAELNGTTATPTQKADAQAAINSMNLSAARLSIRTGGALAPVLPIKLSSGPALRFENPFSTLRPKNNGRDFLTMSWVNNGVTKTMSEVLNKVERLRSMLHPGVTTMFSAPLTLPTLPALDTDVRSSWGDGVAPPGYPGVMSIERWLDYTGDPLSNQRTMIALGVGHPLSGTPGTTNGYWPIVICPNPLVPSTSSRIDFMVVGLGCRVDSSSTQLYVTATDDVPDILFRSFMDIWSRIDDFACVIVGDDGGANYFARALLNPTAQQSGISGAYNSWDPQQLEDAVEQLMTDSSQDRIMSSIRSPADSNVFGWALGSITPTTDGVCRQLMAIEGGGTAALSQTLRAGWATNLYHEAGQNRASELLTAQGKSTTIQ